MFFAKKLVSAFLMPSTLSLLLILAGLLFLWFTSRARLGRLLATLGFGCLLLFSNQGVSDGLLLPLERQYPPLYPRTELERALRQAGGPAPRWIVVLAGSHVADEAVPPNDQLSGSSLARLLEGIRLHREIPGSKLILSGGLGHRPVQADALGAVARACGVKPEDMVLHKQGWDTEEEAATISPRLGQDPFLLVTSASHLPRSVALFRRRGTRPIPAPAQHFTLNTPGLSLSEVLPSGPALAESDAAVHEYVGMLWSKLRGRL